MSTYTGDRIRQYRKEKGLTQKQLGELCGIHEANIRKYELGTQNPKLETLQKIATALHVPVTMLRVGIIPDANEVMKKLSSWGIDKVMAHSEKEKIILDCCKSLNETGQQKAADYVKDLTKISEYRKKE